MKTEKLTVTVPIDLKRELKSLAEKEDRNVSNMASVLMRLGLNDYGIKVKLEDHLKQ